MPSGRHQVAYDGIGYEALTAKVDAVSIVFDATQPGGSTAVGKAVGWLSADTVQLVADAEFVLGKLLNVTPDGFCTVQHEGMVSLPAGTGAALTLGKGIVGALLGAAKGYIREAASGVAAELVLMNGHIVNAAVTTAVYVDL